MQMEAFTLSVTEFKWESVLSIRLGSKMSGTASGSHRAKHAAFCRVCEHVVLLATMGIKAVYSHMKSEKHKKSIIATCDKELCQEREFDSELRVSGRRQCYTGGSIVVEDIRSTFASTECLEMLKAELLWTLQTVAKHQLYQCVVILILRLNSLKSDL